MDSVSSDSSRALIYSEVLETSGQSARGGTDATRWDFGELSRSYPPLIEYVLPVGEPNQGKQAYKLDFRNAAAVACLTEAIMAAEWSVKVKVPIDQLIPAVPLRLNYIKWIETLLSTISEFRSNPVKGIDIGCGAVCIYALIGCARNSTWSFLCSDIDPVSIERAQANVDLNPRFKSKIGFKLQPDPAAVLTNILDPSIQDEWAFCMFNPPFFESAEDKKQRDDTVCTATSSELVHEDGGELALFDALLEESLTKFHKRVRFYTFMFGIKSHLKSAVKKLHSTPEVTHVWKTTLAQGRTDRWAVAWTFHSRSSSTFPAPTTNQGPPPKRRKIDDGRSSSECCASTTKDQQIPRHCRPRMDLDASCPG